MPYMPRTIGVVAICVLTACSTPRPDDAAPSDRTPPLSNDRGPVLAGVDTATDPTVRRLEREAIAIARTGGCTAAQQCASAPVGSRACGGPRFHLPYCPLTTDTAALFVKLAEVERAEREYNRRNEVISTCEMRMPLELELAAGVCRFKMPR